MISIFVDNKEKKYEQGTTYHDIVADYQKDYENDIILVTINGKLQELHKRLIKECKMEFITTADEAGMRTYKRSVTQVMLKAFYDVIAGEKIEKVSILFSLSKGYFCKIKGSVKLDENLLNQVKKRMIELVEDDISVMKRSVNTDDAIALFHNHKMYDKERLFKFRRVSKVNIYSINEFEDYYYGYMVYSTGYLKYFDLQLYEDGFVLQLPSRKNPKVIPPFNPQTKLFKALNDSKNWGDRLNILTVGELNEKITKGELNELILVQEALQEKKIAEIAEIIASKRSKKFVMIAGPSSSGKTTFSHRLSIQLLAHGLKPHPIPIDNYFINRANTPLDEFGEPDLESIKAIDVEQFNKDMTALLRGENVELPTYNFKTGEREYKGEFRQLGKDDILVIEGIHGLNDELSHSLPHESKFKIYISALTQLNVDEHNRIPSTDGRLIRRIIRDARTRGTSAKGTISMWESVRRGEEKNIFPYQEEADVMFDSALIYELAVLKQYAEPLLFSVEKDAPEYSEAKRLLKFLDYFLGISGDEVPNNSILREFTGGSCFKA
ncbi:MAG: nucleoside kinase [Clostridiales bacterium]|nr:nucleoside kinase [Clostridiales bacterium]